MAPCSWAVPLVSRRVIYYYSFYFFWTLTSAMFFFLDLLQESSLATVWWPSWHPSEAALSRFMMPAALYTAAVRYYWVSVSRFSEHSGSSGGRRRFALNPTRRSSPQRSSARAAPHGSPPQTSSRSSNIRSDVKRCTAEPGPPSPRPPSTPSPPPPPPLPPCSVISSLRQARGAEPSLQLWKSKQSLWVPGPIVIHRADKYLIPSKDTFC